VPVNGSRSLLWSLKDWLYTFLIADVVSDTVFSAVFLPLTKLTGSGEKIAPVDKYTKITPGNGGHVSKESLKESRLES
jgi:hypothetical protein